MPLRLEEAVLHGCVAHCPVPRRHGGTPCPALFYGPQS